MDLKLFSKYSKAAIKSLVGSPSTYRGTEINGSHLYQKLSADWISLDNKYLLYKTNPILQAVVNKRANLCAKARLCVVDNNDKEIKGDPLLDLLKKPNFWQNQQTFIRQWVVITSLDGGAFQFPIVPAGFEGTEKVRALVNLPMSRSRMDLKYSNKTLTDYDEFIDTLRDSPITLSFKGNSIRVPFGELIPSYDISDIPTSNDIVKPISRVDSLRYDLSNIQKTLEAMNVMAGKPGGFGIGSKSSTEYTPLMEEERKELEDNFKGYGLSHDKSSVIFSTASINYQSTMVKFKDLGLNDINETSVLNVLSGFDVPPSIFLDNNGAYGTKQEAGELHYIQDNIGSTMDTFTSSLNNYFNYPDQGKRLVAKFDHLHCFSTQRAETSKTLKEVTETLTAAIESKLITPQRAVEIINELTNVSFK